MVVLGVRWSRVGVALLSLACGVLAWRLRAAEAELAALRAEDPGWRVVGYELASGSPVRVTLEQVAAAAGPFSFEVDGPDRWPVRGSCTSFPEPAPVGLQLEIYDVQDLLAPSGPPDLVVPLEPRTLQEVLRALTDRGGWRDPAVLEVHRGQLIVNHTPAVHAQIRALLRALRSTR